eukprot:PITA_36186
MIWWGVVIAAGLAVAASAVWLMSKNGKTWEGKLGEKSELPPGSMGLPFIGETLEYLSPFKTSDGGPFLHKRISRYGDVFKTHIFGQPTIIMASVEANQFVFQNEGRLFKSAYPEAFVSILGENNIVEIHGPMHLKLRKLGLSLVGTPNLKATLLQAVEKQVVESLDTWEEGNIIQVKEETTKITFNMLMKQFISLDSGTAESRSLLKSYSQFMAGLFSLPIRIPGTPYSNCLKGREQVLNALRNVISERRKEKRIVKEDFLDQVLEKADEDKEQFNDEVVLDFLFSFLFAGYDTTSIAMTMAVKYLTETPMALHDLMVMGYRIPKGWKVVACTSAVNLDPSIHFGPLSFNPWRWEKKACNRNGFQAFGGGLRYCVGSELAKLEMGVFLHHLVTQFRWEKACGCEQAITRCPVVLFENGYPIYLTKRI